MVFLIQTGWGNPRAGAERLERGGRPQARRAISPFESPKTGRPQSRFRPSHRVATMAKIKRPGSPRRRWQLQIERFEDRLLLSPFTVTNVNDDGPGSLRQAILDSNTSAGLNTISFSLSGAAPYVINVQSLLPAITNPVVLDGRSQTGYAGTPLVAIDGGGLTGDGLILDLGSDGSTIEGLDIANFQTSTGFDGAGIRIFSDNNIIQANFLGTDPTGTSAGPGNYFGVFLDGASHNTVGGAAALGNLISGNGFGGVLIYDDAQPAQQNLVIGNKIGTDVTGTVAIPNAYTGDGGHGIDIYASGNTIGGIGAGEGNLISGNAAAGISLSQAATSPSENVIQSNYIGTDVTGKIALGNAGEGIADNNGLNNTIGGTATGAGNLISGNAAQGIALITTSGDLIAGNTIGTTPGKITDSRYNFLPLGNLGAGISLTAGSTNNQIGVPGAGNLIAANQNNGIDISASSDFNSISGNAIGTTLFAGSEIIIGPPPNLGNFPSGIVVSNSSANTIGGLTLVDSQGKISQLGGNVVSGNAQSGITIVGNDSSIPPGSPDQGNLVIGNLIGTRSDGTLVVANGADGISLGSTTANTIGGANVLNPDGTINSLLGNVVSGNSLHGLSLNQSSSANLILGNRIGTDLSGSSARPNGRQGILISQGASNNTLGAANLDGSSGNLISGNTESGIEIQDTSTGNQILGNRVGVNAPGTSALPNLGDGVLLSASGKQRGWNRFGVGQRDLGQSRFRRANPWRGSEPGRRQPDRPEPAGSLVQRRQRAKRHRGGQCVVHDHRRYRLHGGHRPGKRHLGKSAGRHRADGILDIHAHPGQPDRPELRWHGGAGEPSLRNRPERGRRQHDRRQPGRRGQRRVEQWRLRRGDQPGVRHHRSGQSPGYRSLGNHRAGKPPVRPGGAQ